MIADPLTLFQCCPTSEGSAAAVLCAREDLAKYGIDENRAVSIAAAVLTSGDYNGRGADHSAFSPYRTEPAALQAYEMSSINPEDVDLAQVQTRQRLASYNKWKPCICYHLARPGRVPWRDEQL